MTTFMSNSYDETVREPVRFRAAVGRAAFRILEALAEWQGRAAERRNLMELDHRMLKDVGLSRADAAGEYAKPFWKP